MAAKKSSRVKKKRSRSIRMIDPEQSARFLEMAKTLEADDSAKRFEDAFSAVQAAAPAVIARTSRRKSSVSKK